MTREALFGKKGYGEADFGDFLEAVGLRNQKPTPGATLNGSGTAAKMHNKMAVGARLTSAFAGNKIGQVMLALPAALKLGRDYGATSLNTVNAKLLKEGKLPQGVQQQMMKEAKMVLYKYYGAEGLDNVGNAVNVMARNLLDGLADHTAEKE